MTRHWIAVASAEHVRRGRAEGFMQVCHGKRGPLSRIRPGDEVVYYSPAVTMGGKDRFQAFTAIGRIRDKEPYEADMGNGFRPYRRDVSWYPSVEAQIRPLLGRLHFTQGGPNWGYRFRFGLFQICLDDFQTISAAMSAAV